VFCFANYLISFAGILEIGVKPQKQFSINNKMKNSYLNMTVLHDAYQQVQHKLCLNDNDMR
jgi:hypothetical protein